MRLKGKEREVETLRARLNRFLRRESTRALCMAKRTTCIKVPTMYLNTSLKDDTRAG